jgi:hypothetical protein
MGTTETINCKKHRLNKYNRMMLPNLFRYASENRSSPRVVTGKWLFKKLNNSFKSLSTRLKNKTWTSPQIKKITKTAINAD